MKHLLAILNRPETVPSVLTAARPVRQRLPGSPASLLHLRPDIDPDYMPMEEVMTADRRGVFEAQRDAISERLAHGVAREGSGSLQQIRGKVREIVATQAAQAGLVIAGSAGYHGHGETEDAIDAVLFDAAAALLLMPEAVPTSLCHMLTFRHRHEHPELVKRHCVPFFMRSDTGRKLSSHSQKSAAPAPSPAQTSHTAQEDPPPRETIDERDHSEQNMRMEGSVAAP